MRPGPQIDPHRLLEVAVESLLVTTAELDFPGPEIIYVNPAFERMTGWAAEDILGRSPRILQGPKTDRAIFRDLKTLLRRGKHWEGKTVNYRRDGSEFVMEWSIVPVLDDRGAINQYLAVQRDITGRVETERQLRESREELIASLRKREQMREIFGKFVPDAIVDRILVDSGRLQPDTREATIFYSDIQGFSTLTEQMAPDAVLRFINEYFELVTGLIENRGGVVHQFQGDAILATFNLPLEDPDHRANAVESALDVLHAVASREFPGGVAAPTRIGINTGMVVAGTVGSIGRLGYTVHGDAVNLAANIEQQNKHYGTNLLVSESTAGASGGGFEFRKIDSVSIKGRGAPVTLYTVDRSGSGPERGVARPE